MPNKEKLVLHVDNLHPDNCGEPPCIIRDASKPDYCSYFENEHGEQWVLTFDRSTGRGQLVGGDANWSNVLKFEIVGTTLQFDGMPVLSNTEKAWVNACANVITCLR